VVELLACLQESRGQGLGRNGMVLGSDLDVFVSWTWGFGRFDWRRIHDCVGRGQGEVGYEVENFRWKGEQRRLLPSSAAIHGLEHCMHRGYPCLDSIRWRSQDGKIEEL